MSVVELIDKGGFVMYPLLIFSIIIWAVAFEKIWFLSQLKKQFVAIHGSACKLLEENKVHEAKGLFHNTHPMLIPPFQAVIEGKSENREVWEQKISRRLSETQMGLRRYLWILGTIGSSAPFIGLFGTVVGIIKSFDSMAKTGKSGFTVVSSGLSEALIATAAGIIVAVIAVIFYNYFQTRLQNLGLEFKNKLEDLVDVYTGE